jgi:hypothetical protein
MVSYRICNTYFMAILAENVSFEIPIFWRHWCHLDFIIQVFPQLKNKHHFQAYILAVPMTLISRDRPVILFTASYNPMTFSAKSLHTTGIRTVHGVINSLNSTAHTFQMPE